MVALSCMAKQIFHDLLDAESHSDCSTNATNCTAADYPVILKWPFYRYSSIGPVTGVITVETVFIINFNYQFNIAL